MMEIKNLSASYGGDLVLKDISFRVLRREICGILGINGCGKSTLLRVIMGFHPMISGEVLVGGKDVSHLTPHERGLAYMPQQNAKFPALSVWANLAISRNVSSSCNVEEMAKKLNISHLLDRTFGLSGGEERRVALGRSLLSNCAAVLFDEPFNSLDAPTKRSFRKQVRALLNEEKKCAVVVTHDVEDLIGLGARRVGIIEGGRLVQFGELENVMANPASDYVTEVLKQGG